MTAPRDNGELPDLPGPLVLIGAGKMGGALLDGWLHFGFDPGRIMVIEPQPTPAMSPLGARGLHLTPNAAQLAGAAAVVIAVKPQAAAEALAAAAPSIGANTVVVSIMAGKTLQSLADGVPPGCPRPRHYCCGGAGRKSATAQVSRSPLVRDRHGRMDRG